MGDVEQLPTAARGICDLLLKSGDYLFLVDVKHSCSAAPVYMAARNLRNAVPHVRRTRPAAQPTTIVPMLVVPFMGETGRRICEDEGLAWFDLSGNADIRAKGLRIRITGNENRFKKRGRKATPFAPKASRVARQFLLEHPRGYTQKELVQLTGLDQGFVSRVLRRLEAEKLVARSERNHDRASRTVRRKGVYTVANPSLLLQSWQDEYEFTRHRIIQGHVATRTSEGLLASLASIFRDEGLTTAATGLAGAWLLTHFASFRLVTVYVDREPPQQLLSKLGFRQGDRGANTWLVVPNDESVFAGRQQREAIWCAHPVQVYLDLKFHPERSSEAAQRVRERYLDGKDDA